MLANQTQTQAQAQAQAQDRRLDIVVGAIAEMVKGMEGAMEIPTKVAATIDKYFQQ